ncbi:MAG TPA: hypothetical protein VH041_15940 [Caldimonas sp.]|jgi:hypothetical protein|nr:hypothetical protein [Caldimonas sp.]HEX4235785.1 hypothetical protein [Caldimonas sp.]
MAEKTSPVSSLEACWTRFRQELDARIAARFELPAAAPDDEEPDPAALADLALQRALMP